MFLSLDCRAYLHASGSFQSLLAMPPKGSLAVSCSIDVGGEHMGMCDMVSNRDYITWCGVEMGA